MRTSSSLAAPQDVVRLLTCFLQDLTCFFGRHSPNMLRAVLSLRDATRSLCTYSMSSFLFAPSICCSTSAIRLSSVSAPKLQYVELSSGRFDRGSVCMPRSCVVYQPLLRVDDFFSRFRPDSLVGPVREEEPGFHVIPQVNFQNLQD